MYPVQIIIKETPSNWSKATAILDTIKAKNGTDSVDTVSGAVTTGDLAEVGGLAGLNNRVTTVNCYAFGSVTANSASNHFGGFIGQAVGIHVNTAAGNFIPAFLPRKAVGLVFLAAGQYQNTNTRLRRARLGAAH
ncbi:MAG: hypothetical protein KH006_07215 [Firmicutes bacterium]|nr:hypothetical protein [Bacillota bacterium]